MKAAGLFLLLLLASPAAQPAEAGAKEQELRELRGRIEALQKRLADAEGTRSEAADALKESERAISDANRELRELGLQSKEINRQVAELNAESRRGETELQAQQTLLARLLYQHYLGGQSEPSWAPVGMLHFAVKIGSTSRQKLTGGSICAPDFGPTRNAISRC